MLNTSGSPPMGSAPSASTRSTGTPGEALSPPKCKAINSRGNLSIPAGTGVWVVNTVPARTTSRASSKVRPAAVSSRIRSTPWKPACPSLVWNTSGAAVPEMAQNARTARTPPMPSSISCSSRWSLPHPHSRTVRGAQQLDRQAVRVDGGVALQLPTVGGQGLLEVATTVEQADADDRYAEVAGRLEVVPGEDAQAAGVLRQDLGDPELGREVGNGARYVGQALVPAGAGEVVVEVLGGIGEPAQEPAVLGQRSHPLGGDGTEQPDRVAAAPAPGLRVDRLEQVERVGVPGPAQVHHQPV